MANYDLYTELQLDKDMPPYEIAEVLGARASDLRNQGYGSDSPELDQVDTARAILGDPYKRDIYEAALYGPEDDVVNIRWLHDLADSQSPSFPSGTAAAPTGYPSYDAYEPQTASDAQGDDQAAGDLSGIGGPSAEATREHSVDDAAGSSSDLEATRVTAAVPEPATDAEAGSDLSAGDGPTYQGPTQNAWQQPAPSVPSSGFSGGQHAAQPGQFPQPQQPQQRPGSQLDMSNWGVGDRRRSESKIYLAILAIIAVGMIYPLIVLLTAGQEDLTAPLSVMKATLFTLAHVAAWVSINEIIWGVRKIVAPNRPTEK
ncbi:hypothetical protein [Corynebacterium glyciniphilum]|uniref:hypothetical protein n=1 Tax=Corynebacterium glyciniphilum TaxID=1404244 RepID=UPI0011AB4FF3|nr:hypothetical protein [Corynebacterium glyciniphilum]